MEVGESRSDTVRWLRGLAMHRSRPICRFDADCQSLATFHELFPSLIRLADLSLRQWVSDRGTGRSAHPRPAAAPLVLLVGAKVAGIVPTHVGGGAPIHDVSRLSHFSTRTGRHPSSAFSSSAGDSPPSINARFSCFRNRTAPCILGRRVVMCAAPRTPLEPTACECREKLDEPKIHR
jgi:hypothetical protein